MLWTRGVRKILNRIKEKGENILHDVFRSPFSWKNIFWDSYLGDGLPEKTMRFTRLITIISIIFRFVNTTFLGIYLALDGFYSIYRNRFELKLTKSWEEDVPRFARVILGILITLNFYTLF